ncbi:PhnA protein [Bifidobacterium catenulatum]|uniref:PhnA protein n=1 Tax=Bifidobacterium catenulatum subsp. kashiwanohense TaxID=630129 RepID=A0AA43P9M3_9BIFI|nr:PhnA protein [Bifidobacterium catenulatum]MDH7891148.1 PhnA protein [Bifidobacterium catenulatum subsp. kashiwanohense]
MTDCQHCGKPASGTLCAKCTADYWAMIYQLGHIQLPTLRSIMLRQAHIGTPAHTPNKGTAPLPIDTHAQDLIADSEAWLAEQAGKIRAAYAAYDWRKAWYAIISNRHTILTMSTAADDYANLQHITRRNEQALTPEEAMVIIGTCPKCGHQATSTPQAETWTCPACKWQGGVQAIKATRDNKLWQLEYTGKPVEVARYLAKMDIHCTSDQIRQWLTRGKLHATPTKHKGEYVFNLGEITAMLDCHN